MALDWGGCDPTNLSKSPISHPRAFWHHCHIPIEHPFDSKFLEKVVDFF